VVPGQFGAADRTHNEPRGLERRQRWLGGFGTDSSQTPRWREMDSNFQYAGAVKRAVTPARLRRVGAPFLPTILSGTRPKATRSAIAVAGSLRRLPTRPKQLGASKGARTSSPRPRTRSSNPVPSSAESANYPFRAGLPTLVQVASSASAFGLVPKTRSRRAQARSDGRPQQRAAPRGPLGLVRKLPNRPLIELNIGSQPVSDTICCSGDRYRTHQRAVFGGGPVSR
jgi:hypothetical protein